MIQLSPDLSPAKPSRPGAPATVGDAIFVLPETSAPDILIATSATGEPLRQEDAVPGTDLPTPDAALLALFLPPAPVATPVTVPDAPDSSAARPIAVASAPSAPIEAAAPRLADVAAPLTVQSRPSDPAPVVSSQLPAVLPFAPPHRDAVLAQALPAMLPVAAEAVTFLPAPAPSAEAGPVPVSEPVRIGLPCDRGMIDLPPAMPGQTGAVQVVPVQTVAVPPVALPTHWRMVAAPVASEAPVTSFAPAVADAPVPTPAPIIGPSGERVPPPLPRREAAAAVVPPAASIAAVIASAVAVRRDEPATERPAGSVGSAAAITAAAPLAAAFAPVAEPATLDMRHEHWPRDMVAHIERLQDAADAADTRIRLVPDALGGVAVDVRRDGDTIHVRFQAEQAQTRTLLQDAQPRLAEAAEARGLRLGQSSVDGGAGQHQQQHRQPAAPPAARPSAPRSAAAAPERADDGVRIA